MFKKLKEFKREVKERQEIEAKKAFMELEVIDPCPNLSLESFIEGYKAGFSCAAAEMVKYEIAKE